MDREQRDFVPAEEYQGEAGQPPACGRTMTVLFTGAGKSGDHPIIQDCPVAREQYEQQGALFCHALGSFLVRGFAFAIDVASCICAELRLKAVIRGCLASRVLRRRAH